MPPLHNKQRIGPSASFGDIPAGAAAESTADVAPPSGSARRKAGRVASGGLQLVRRSVKRRGQCNIEGCLYRPRTMLSAAMFNSTAEFHHCSRCQSDFCVNHMAWVTHERTLMETCPLDARCICELCWIELRRHGQPVPAIGTAFLLCPIAFVILISPACFVILIYHLLDSHVTYLLGASLYLYFIELPRCCCLSGCNL